MDTLFENFLREDCAAVPAVVGEWMSADQIAALLQRDMENNSRRLVDQEAAQRLMEVCPVPGATVDDYLYRVIALGDGRHVLTSLRFFGLDRRVPFIEILHRDFPWESPSQVQAVARDTVRHYALFAPARVRLYDASGLLDSCTFAHNDLRYYTAPVQVLCAQPPPRRYEEVRLERAADLAFYERYVELYEHLYEERPHLRGVVPTESRDTLSVPLQQETLFSIVIGGEWAGVIAVIRSAERFLEGYIVVEEILGGKFRGQGFAPAVQRRLLDELDGSDNAMLYGHISPVNTVSLRTAARVGRRDVGGMYFVDAGA